MAGEWIKFEANTPEKPEVFAITVALGWDDPDLTVGKLLKIWRWFDQQTIEGNAYNVTLSLLDRISGVSGFAQAMADVGWLVITPTGLMLPHFDRHNGKTAKDRALTAKRVAKHKSNADTVSSVVISPLPREEKRREEKNIKTNTTPEGDLFLGVNEQIVKDFKALRVTHRAKVTKTAIDGIKREALKAGVSFEDALRICCERGWRGFKAEWLLPKSDIGITPPAFVAKPILPVEQQVPALAAVRSEKPAGIGDLKSLVRKV